MATLRTFTFGALPHLLSPKIPRQIPIQNFTTAHQYLFLLTCISSMRQLLQIHSHLLTSGLLFSDKFLVSEILRFCSLHPSGGLSHARTLLFHSPIPMSSSWNHVIRGLCLNSSSEEAVAVFLEMGRRAATRNELTYPFVIKSCAEMLDICVGRQVHADAMKNAVVSVVYVGNTLMHLYGSCGEIRDAWRVFDGMFHRTIISWNTILNVYVDSLMMKEAMELLDKMIIECEFDQTTYIILLSASALMGNLGLGKWVHSQIISRGNEVNLKMGTALVHMYAKCGALDFSAIMFEKMPMKNVWTWSAMILGFAQHGAAREALDLFQQMKNSFIKPNYVTFLGVLCACSHAGLVNEGYKFFHEMVHIHGIKPEMSHYSTMVDVLGRKGLLLEAYNFIKKVPMDPDVVVWRTLLSACQLHGTRDVHDIGEVAKKSLLMQEPNRCGNFVIVANIYSELGSWEKAAKIRKKMREGGLKKMAGVSCIEVGGLNYSFLSGVDFSSDSEGIHQLLDNLHLNMKKPGIADPHTLIQLQQNCHLSF